MATSAEIKRNISHTRQQVSETVDDLSNIIHKKIDIQEKVKENPYGALITALATGFILATFTKTFGKSLMKFAFKSGYAAAGAYVSRQGIKYITAKLK